MRALLADGGWHGAGELVAELRTLVPPERAIRRAFATSGQAKRNRSSHQYTGRNIGVENVSDRAFWTGQLRILNDHVRDIRRRDLDVGPRLEQSGDSWGRRYRIRLEPDGVLA